MSTVDAMVAAMKAANPRSKFIAQMYVLQLGWAMEGGHVIGAIGESEQVPFYGNSSASATFTFKLDPNDRQSAPRLRFLYWNQLLSAVLLLCYV